MKAMRFSVAGPTLACGYINRPELNKNRFVDVPAEYQREVGSNRMYRSGDWVSFSIFNYQLIERLMIFRVICCQTTFWRFVDVVIH